MHHLFLGISPASLVHAPYTPAVSERLVLNAGDYGLAVQERAELIMLSDIAGYVGADTCGCLLAIRQDQQEEISLMIDIGTNGERNCQADRCRCEQVAYILTALIIGVIINMQ